MPSAGCTCSVGMVSTGGGTACESVDWTQRRADRDDYCARTCAHSQAGLFRESFPDWHGDAALLPPCGLVGEPANSKGARTLLRRSSRGTVRQCRELCARAHLDGRVAHRAFSGDGGKRQPGFAARRPAAGSGWTCGKISPGRHGRRSSVPGGSDGGGQCFPRRGACGVWNHSKHQSSARPQQLGFGAGAGQQQRDRGAAGNKAFCVNRTGQGQRKRPERRQRCEEGILSGRDGGGGLQEPLGG